MSSIKTVFLCPRCFATHGLVLLSMKKGTMEMPQCGTCAGGDMLALKLHSEGPGID